MPSCGTGATVIIVDEIVSADGFAARAGGAIDFFEDREDVVSSVGSPERMTQVSAVLLGATTYREFSDYWPGQSPAASVNRLPKHVLSNNLAIAPWGDLQPATVERGDAATVTRRLAGQYPGDIIVWGSLSVARAILAARIVDEVWLRVVPVAVGAGRTFFPEVDVPMSLVDTHVNANCLALRYRVSR